MHFAIKPNGKTTSGWKKFIVTLALITFTASIFIGVQLDGSFRNEISTYSNDTTQPLLEELKTVQDISFSLNIQVFGDAKVSGKKKK
jgi:hypothetical protein